MRGVDTYRIRFDDDMAFVELIGVDLMAGKPALKQGWHLTEKLPDWVQRKVAVLMMCSGAEAVANVGWRSGENAFWVYDEGNHEETGINE